MDDSPWAGICCVTIQPPSLIHFIAPCLNNLLHSFTYCLTAGRISYVHHVPFLGGASMFSKSHLSALHKYALGLSFTYLTHWSLCHFVLFLSHRRFQRVAVKGAQCDVGAWTGRRRSWTFWGITQIDVTIQLLEQEAQLSLINRATHPCQQLLLTSR